MLAAWYHPILFSLFLITCVLLILIVLLQKGRGGGLGAMFGGAGSGAFGTRTGDVLTWVTIVLTALFLLLAIGATMAFRPTGTVVAEPVFDPKPPGNINEINHVKLATSTVGATIEYQVGGSESAIYEPDRVIPVPPGVPITAWATRVGWKDSKKVEKVYGVGELPDQSDDLDTVSPDATGAGGPAEAPAAAAPDAPDAVAPGARDQAPEAPTDPTDGDSRDAPG